MTLKIKAFTPYALASTAFYDWCGKAAKSNKTAGVIGHFLAVDPHATEWSSMGLTSPVEEGSPVHDLDGTARLLMYQFNERILPGAVRDEILVLRAAELAEREGGKLNRKQYAILKEDVETELLPKAFIRRSLVPVLVYPGHLLICTTSGSKCDKILAHLMRLTDTRKVEFPVDVYDTIGTTGSLIGRIARAGVEYLGDDDEICFQAGTSMVIKGSDKRTIRIKDRSVISEDIAPLLKDGDYMVTELGVTLEVLDEPIAEFTLASNMVFKGIKLSGVTSAGVTDDDTHATGWLLAKTFLTMVNDTLKAMNEGAEDGEEL